MRSQLTKTVKTIAVVAIAGGWVSCCSGCSVFLQATRPTPVDINQFATGENRDGVREKLGAPVQAITEANGEQCDVYDLYTRGYGAVGKIPIAMTEAAADAFTLGLAEIVLTPVEAATRNAKYPVTFCYQDDKLERVTQSDTPVSGR